MTDTNVDVQSLGPHRSVEPVEPVGWRIISPLHVFNPPESQYSTINAALSGDAGPGSPRPQRPRSSTSRSMSPSLPVSARRRSASTVTNTSRAKSSERDDGDLASSLMNLNLNLGAKTIRCQTVTVPGSYIECTTYEYQPAGWDLMPRTMRPSHARAQTFSGYSSVLGAGPINIMRPTNRVIFFYSIGSRPRERELGILVKDVLADTFCLEGEDDRVFADLPDKEIRLKVSGPGIRETLRNLQVEGSQMKRKTLLRHIATRIVEMMEQPSPRHPEWAILLAAEEMRIKLMSHICGSGEWRVELGS